MPPVKLPIIQDKAIIAVRTKGKPIGEANAAGYPGSIFPMSVSERQDMVQRLDNSISEFMDEAQKTYQENCYKPGTTEIDPDYITRLSTNEFFFYTKEPLTLKEFEQLQNKLAEKGKTMSQGVQLILGSFAVQTEDGKVMNVTPHITCGSSPDFHFVVKNHTSTIDVRYKIPDGKGGTQTLPVLDKKRTSSPMPQILINGSAREFSFNNIIPCKTPGGIPFLTAIDVCLDHYYAVAKENYYALAKKDPTLLKQPVSHVVVSNIIPLIEKKSIGPASEIMHVDPAYSLMRCKQSVEQKASPAQKNVFGSVFKTLDVVRQNVYPFLNIKNNYIYSTIDPSVGRDHRYTVALDKVQYNKAQDIPKFQEFKTKYQAYRGDYLKTKILEDLKKRIEDTTSLEELDCLKKELESSFEYDVLKTGQDIFTQLFGIKTFFSKALENMIEQQENYLSEVGLKYKN